MTGLVILLVLLAVTSVLLTIAIGGNADLAEENRRLRRELADERHPARRIAPGANPIFDVTLAEIMSLPQVDDTTGGAA